MLDFITEAGWGIYPVMLFGAASLGAAVSHVRGQAPESQKLLVVLCVLTLLAGALGTVTGLQASSRYIEAAPDKWLFLVGLREALNNAVAALLWVGLSLVVLTVRWLKPNGPAHAPLSMRR